MYSINKDYWFTIEPYTYTYLKNNELILLNTLNNYIIKTCDNKIIELIKRTQSEENLSVTLLKGDELKENNLLEFVKELRENFMGDIIDIQLSNGKPIQFVSKANLLDNTEITWLQPQLSKEENILSDLDEVNIIINAANEISATTKQIYYCQNSMNSTPIINLSLKDIRKFCEKVYNTSARKISIIGDNICAHPEIAYIIEYFKTSEINVEFVFNSNSINSTLFQECPKRSNIIYISRKNEFVSYINNHHINCQIENFIFIVQTDNHLELLNEIVSFWNIQNYRILPLYNGKNISFFKKNVYLEEADIYSIPQEIKDIHAKQLLNSNDFGKFTITPDGKVYANLYHKPLGSINDNIKELINKELEVGTSWRRIRNMKPCRDCVYQWLCPSPSNYELAICRPNLCHVKS